MLKGIDPLISVPLMTALMEMGHGNEIVFADANFPAVSNAKRIIYYAGHPIIPVLTAVLKHLPLDYAVDFSAILMAPPPANPLVPPIWEEFEALLKKEKDGDKPLLKLQKPDFYARSREAFAIVLTGERRKFSNIILRKGIIEMEEV